MNPNHPHCEIWRIKSQKLLDRTHATCLRILHKNGRATVTSAKTSYDRLLVHKKAQELGVLHTTLKSRTRIIPRPFHTFKTFLNSHYSDHAQDKATFDAYMAHKREVNPEWHPEAFEMGRQIRNVMKCPVMSLESPVAYLLLIQSYFLMIEPSVLIQSRLSMVELSILILEYAMEWNSANCTTLRIPRAPLLEQVSNDERADIVDIPSWLYDN